MNIFKDSRIQCSVACMVDQDCYAYNIIKRNGPKKNGCQLIMPDSFEENDEYDSIFNDQGEPLIYFFNTRNNNFKQYIIVLNSFLI